MIFTPRQLKHLESDGEYSYKFVGQDKATKEEKEMLLNLDEANVYLGKGHLITNYEELKN